MQCQSIPVNQSDCYTPIGLLSSISNELSASMELSATATDGCQITSEYADTPNESLQYAGHCTEHGRGPEDFFELVVNG